MIAAASPAGPRAAAVRLRGPVSLEMVPRAVLASPAPPAGLPPGSEVYLPALPRAGFDPVCRAAERLLAWHMRPVPHLAARRVPDRGWLEAQLARLAALGVDRLMLVGGDCDRPAGPYDGVPALLQSGLLLRHGFRRLGIAGHPEGHPQVPEAALSAALEAKRRYAAATGTELWLVTQFVFEPAPLLAWLDGLQARGIALPVRVGLPGPARPAILLRYALQCGVAASAQGLRRQGGVVRRLAGRWSPDPVAAALQRYCDARPDCPVAGLHLFPFGGIERSLAWAEGWRRPPGRMAGRGGRR